jgi:hypothetical protein
MFDRDAGIILRLIASVYVVRHSEAEIEVFDEILEFTNELSLRFNFAFG